MRTTLTLEDDVEQRLKAAMQEHGTSFKETVNTVLRRGLEALEQAPPPKPFVVRARDLGSRVDVDFDDIPALLEQLDGPDYR